MNVLFLTSTFPRWPGDQQAPFVLEQARAWKVRRPGDRLHILAPHHAGASRREVLDGIDIRRFRYMPLTQLQTLAYPAIMPNIRERPLRALQVVPFLIAQYAAARSLLRQEAIDLVYAHWAMPQGIVALALSRSLGLPYVLQNHSSDLSVFTKLGAPGRALARRVLRGAEAFFCVNSDQAVFARRLVPELRPNVLPMGVSLDLDAAAGRGVGKPRFNVGTIARLSRKKGIHHLIDAAEALAAAGRPTAVGIAGDGEEAAALQTRASASSCHFAGFVSGEHKAAFFGECQTMAFPSVEAAGDVEGLPVALLEALAAGKPVVASAATNIRLLPEWTAICDDVEFLEDPADTPAFAAALSRLIHLTETDASARSDRLRRIMGRYAWDKLIDEYLAVVDAVSAPWQASIEGRRPSGRTGRSGPRSPS
ncbi:MAG: glycosyltransferase [Pseudomonadota bacterium]